MAKEDRWGSYPIIGATGTDSTGPLGTLRVSLRDSGEEAGIIHKVAEDRYLAFAYDRDAEGRTGRLHPLTECTSFHAAADALRREHRSRSGGRSGHSHP